MKIYTVHNGCEANLYDSEKAKNQFLSDSAATTSTAEEADIVVFHGCTFSQFKEAETKKTIKDLLNTNAKKIIVSGCYLSKYVEDDRINYVKNEELEGYIDKIKTEERFRREKKNSVPDLNLMPFVSISRGCYGSCTFCSIKKAKGIHKSRPIEEILIDIEVRQHHGFVKLVADETAGYGMDIGINLKTLVDAIVLKFPDLKIKFGSLNVKLLKRFTDEELSVFASKNIGGNIHLPIQSASNRILSLMCRGYTIEEYLNVYHRLKRLGVRNISGDIICGFPGENENDHHANIAFITSNAFSFLEAFAYQERDGTKAAAYDQLDFSIRKKRTIEVIANFVKGYSSRNKIPYTELVKMQRVFNTNI
jgi:MiaB/RimO family radical SAM methylthiotransferase